MTIDFIVEKDDTRTSRPGDYCMIVDELRNTVRLPKDVAEKLQRYHKGSALSFYSVVCFAGSMAALFNWTPQQALSAKEKIEAQLRQYYPQKTFDPPDSTLFPVNGVDASSAARWRPGDQIGSNGECIRDGKIT